MGAHKERDVASSDKVISSLLDVAPIITASTNKHIQTAHHQQTTKNTKLTQTNIYPKFISKKKAILILYQIARL